MSLRNLRRRVREEAARHRGPSTSRVLPGDVVEFCVEWLGYEPYAYMYPFLRDEGHFIANVQARQTGKTFNGMAKLLWYAFRYPGSLILVTAPKYDQAKNVAFKALHGHLERMRGLDLRFFDYVVGKRNVLKTVIRFRNGSAILTLRTVNDARTLAAASPSPPTSPPPAASGTPTPATPHRSPADPDSSSPPRTPSSSRRPPPPTPANTSTSTSHYP